MYAAVILNPLPDVFVGSVIFLAFKDEKQGKEIERQVIAYPILLDFFF